MKPWLRNGKEIPPIGKLEQACKFFYANPNLIITHLPAVNQVGGEPPGQALNPFRSKLQGMNSTCGFAAGIIKGGHNPSSRQLDNWDNSNKLAIIHV